MRDDRAIPGPSSWRMSYDRLPIWRLVQPFSVRLSWYRCSWNAAGGSPSADSVLALWHTNSEPFQFWYHLDLTR